MLPAMQYQESTDTRGFFTDSTGISSSENGNFLSAGGHIFWGEVLIGEE